MLPCLLINVRAYHNIFLRFLVSTGIEFAILLFWGFCIIFVSIPLVGIMCLDRIVFFEEIIKYFMEEPPNSIVPEFGLPWCHSRNVTVRQHYKCLSSPVSVHQATIKQSDLYFL